MNRHRWCLRDYDIRGTLYVGYAATVLLAKCKHSQHIVVLKIYSRCTQAPDVAQHEMYREVAIQSSLQHSNIVHLYAAFQEAHSLVLVQEYATHGDLLSLMREHGGRLDERMAVECVLQPLLQALHYLHRWGIVHRDIKPENVLFTVPHQTEEAAGTGGAVLKLADFGLAINLLEERPISRVGTLDYMAPEVVRCPVKQSMAPTACVPRYSAHVDVWGLGVMVYEMLVGLPPFAADTRHEVEALISGASITFPSGMSAAACDFISRALLPHPGDRPTVRDMLHHPWITGEGMFPVPACRTPCYQRAWRGPPVCSSSQYHPEQASMPVDTYYGQQPTVSSLRPMQHPHASAVQHHHHHNGQYHHYASAGHAGAALHHPQHTPHAVVAGEDDDLHASIPHAASYSAQTSSTVKSAADGAHKADVAQQWQAIQQHLQASTIDVSKMSIEQMRQMVAELQQAMQDMESRQRRASARGSATTIGCAAAAAAAARSAEAGSSGLMVEGSDTPSSINPESPVARDASASSPFHTAPASAGGLLGTADACTINAGVLPINPDAVHHPQWHYPQHMCHGSAALPSDASFTAGSCSMLMADAGYDAHHAYGRSTVAQEQLPEDMSVDRAAAATQQEGDGHVYVSVTSRSKGAGAGLQGSASGSLNAGAGLQGSASGSLNAALHVAAWVQQLATTV